MESFPPQITKLQRKNLIHNHNLIDNSLTSLHFSSQMMLLLHTSPTNTINSYISQNLWSFNSNKYKNIYHHYYYSSSSSVWKLINVNESANVWNYQAVNGVAMLAAAVVLSTPPPSEDYFSNIPSELSGKSCDPMDKDCDQANTQLKKRIQRPKSRNAEICTTKCVETCIRGDDGSPGQGPLDVRRPIIVFKQGFRSRQYCLVECSEICNLLDGVDKGR